MSQRASGFESRVANPPRNGHSIWPTVCWRDKSARRKPTHPLNLKLSLAIATPKRHSCVNSGHCRTRDGNAAGLDAFDAKSLQRREELAQGRANAVEKHGVARRLVSPIVRPSDRPLQVVHRPTEARPQSRRSRIRARPPRFVRRGVACSRLPPELGAGGRAGRRSRSRPRPRRAPGRRPTGLRPLDGLCRPNHHAPSGYFPCTVGWAGEREEKRAFSLPCDGRRRLP